MEGTHAREKRKRTDLFGARLVADGGPHADAAAIDGAHVHRAQRSDRRGREHCRAIERRARRVRGGGGGGGAAREIGAGEHSEAALLQDGRVVVVRVAHRPAARVPPRALRPPRVHEARRPVRPHAELVDRQ